MYCFNCGKEIPDSAKFCPHCGIEQKSYKLQDEKPGKKKSPWKILRRILLILIIVPLALLGLLMLFIISSDDDVQVNSGTAAIVEDSDPAEMTTAPSEAEVPDDGWHIENGDRYYFEDGLMYVELHEIDDELYFFDDDGVLALNKDVEYDGDVLHAGRDGKIEAITYEEIFGKWSEKSYHFGNGGSSSILDLAIEVENCDSFDFYLESNGERGAKVNGNWRVYIRCNGKWEFVEKINYSEPSGTFTFTFDSPKTFDAITAYPTVQGNARYSSLFYLKNVHCYI